MSNPLQEKSTHKGIASMDISGVYCVTNRVDGLVYIGKSTGVKRREHQERCACKPDAKHPEKANVHLRKAVLKYGIENFTWEVIQKCEVQELLEVESFFINLYKSYDRKYGYNVERAAAGENVRSEETKRKISSKLKGIKFSNEHKQNMSIGWKEKSHDEWNELREIRRANALGKKQDITVVELKSHKIVCKETSETFSSISDGSRKLGISKSSIYSQLSGKLTHTHGLHFSYL